MIELPTDLTDLRLPHTWDDHPINWGEWVEPLTRFLCANNQLHEYPSCVGCGHIWQPWMIRGHTYDWRTVLDLNRCAYCAYTTMTSRDTGNGDIQEWVLDETDYD